MDPMNDLEHELMAALQVEPSAGFAARVRTQIASEAAAPRWRVPGLAWAAGGTALVALAATLMFPPPASVPPGRATLLAHRDLAPIVPFRARTPSMSPRSVARPESQVTATEVLVSRSEMLALRRLFSGEIVAPPAGDVPDEISIPMITVDAIKLPAIPEGDHQ